MARGVTDANAARCSSTAPAIAVDEGEDVGGAVALRIGF
jgi:hypothetical protein